MGADDGPCRSLVPVGILTHGMCRDTMLLSVLLPSFVTHPAAYVTLLLAYPFLLLPNAFSFSPP
eukprot:m.49318 g.49318  ORF g.49318 m.49318 type:complete len:64 (+) comp7103_c0_seq1:1244-1435(+)